MDKVQRRPVRRHANPGAAEALKKLPAASSAPAGRFMVEATASGFLQPLQSSEVVNRIRDPGVDLAIEDFGTRYSSLARLQTRN